MKPTACDVDARNREIINRYLAGATQRDLAADYGLTRGGIVYILRAHGVPSDRLRGQRQQKGKPKRGHRRLPWQDDSICEDYRNMRRLGFSADAAREIIERHIAKRGVKS